MITQAARDIGCLGYVARASGLITDARMTHPFCDSTPAPAVPIHTTGDVLARFLVRAQEIDASCLDRAAHGHRDGRHRMHPLGRGKGPCSGVGIVEGWCGTITTRVEISADGTLSRVKPVAPSFFNWPALPVALPTRLSRTSP